MAVQQNDLRNLFTGNMSFTTQAKHMFGMFTFIRIPDTGLAGKEGLEPFILQIIQQCESGNVRITRAAGFMFSSLNTLGT